MEVNGSTEPEELTREKNLWQLFKASQKLPTTSGPGWARFVGVILVSLYVGFSLAVGYPESSVVASTTRELAKDGLGFSSQVIGFVLAGFTIFATMNAREFTLRMALTVERTSGFSFIKYTYLSFIRVFALYIGFICVCLLVRLLGEAGGAVSVVVGMVPLGWNGLVRSVVSRAAFLVIAVFFWVVAIELYSFTFNVYHTVMSGVRWDLMRYKNEQVKLKAQAELKAQAKLWAQAELWAQPKFREQGELNRTAVVRPVVGSHGEGPGARVSESLSRRSRLSVVRRIWLMLRRVVG